MMMNKFAMLHGKPNPLVSVSIQSPYNYATRTHLLSIYIL